MIHFTLNLFQISFQVFHDLVEIQFSMNGCETQYILQIVHIILLLLVVLLNNII